MSDSQNEIESNGSERGYFPPPKEKTDCDRCGDEKMISIVDRCRPALCDDCERLVEDLDAPDKGREITPMDKRWR
jgi:hypothetical protein